jgi:membrane protease YdiL (CAAX protease family)
VTQITASKTGNSFLIFSPFLVLIVTQLIAIKMGKYLEAQVYIPIILIYWVLLAVIIFKYGAKQIKIWLKPPEWSIGWSTLALVVGLSSLPIFLKFSYVLETASVLIPTVIFFIINPWLEEFYWRGLLIDATSHWSTTASVLYSSVLFTVWHSAFAWQSEATRNVPFFISVLVLGIIMVLLYKKTKSLWLGIASHMLINMLNMGIPTIQNMIQP